MEIYCNDVNVDNAGVQLGIMSTRCTENISSILINPYASIVWNIFEKCLFYMLLQMYPHFSHLGWGEIVVFNKELLTIWRCGGCGWPRRRRRPPRRWWGGRRTGRWGGASAPAILRLSCPIEILAEGRWGLDGHGRLHGHWGCCSWRCFVSGRVPLAILAGGRLIAVKWAG